MVRRIVTGEQNGKSVFVSDGPVATTHDYAAVPGFRTTLAWATLQGGAPLPHEGGDPAVSVQSVVPDPHGGASFRPLLARRLLALSMVYKPLHFAP